MNRLALHPLFIALALFFCPGFAGAGLAQQKPPLQDLFLPGHKVHTLAHPTQKSWVILSEKPLEDHLKYYLALCHDHKGKPARWQITSPSRTAALAWIEALHHTPSTETANFMLNLHHIQTGVNVSLTIGELKATSAPPFRSIITLYTPHKRKGGK
jgi:hypothetical protein